MVNDVLTMCSYCKNVKDPETGDFITKNSPLYSILIEQYKDNISHGACEPCGKNVKEEIRKYKESKLAEKTKP